MFQHASYYMLAEFAETAQRTQRRMIFMERRD